MDTVRLGRTNLIVSKNGFGALPIQRVEIKKKVLLFFLHHANTETTSLSKFAFSRTAVIE